MPGTEPNPPRFNNLTEHFAAIDTTLDRAPITRDEDEDTIDYLERILHHYQGQVSDSKERLATEVEKKLAAMAESRSHREERDRVVADNDNLRTELHRVELELAKVQGYVDRVHEFDNDAERDAEDRALQGIAQRRYERTHPMMAGIDRAFVNGSERELRWFHRPRG